MYRQFGLVLMVNHSCNLRCTYCYTGAKFNRRMDRAIGIKAIDRALASLEPGGTLELGFFGGEPLLEPNLIRDLIDHARFQAAACGVMLRLSMTTNGTQVAPAAWEIVNLPDLELAISHDGLPQVHDRHRRGVDGSGTSALVLETLERLAASQRDFRVVMVVRPDTVESLPEGIRYLRSHGVRRIEPSLDLWTHWTTEDGQRLASSIGDCARLWAEGLPEFSLSWFDEKLALLTAVPLTETARCGFGAGEIAVAPSGNLYPC